MDVLFPRGLSALPGEGRRARLPVSSGTPSYAAPLDPAIVPRHAGSGRSTYAVGQPDLQRATSVLPAEKPNALDRPSLTKASRGAVGRPVSLREGMRLPGPAAREGQGAIEAQEATPAAISAGGLRTTIPRRHGGGSEGQTIQPKIAGPEPASVEVSVQKVSTDEHRINGWLPRPASASESERHSGTGLALSVDSLRRRQSVDTLHANALDGYEAPVTISTGDLGATILRRHLSGPAGRAFQRGAALLEPAHAEHRFTVEGERSPLAYPATSEAQHPAEAQASMPAVTGSSDIGVGILQRRLAGSAGQDIRHTVSSPDLGPLTNRMSRLLPAMHLARTEELGLGTVTRVIRSGATSFAARREMPLAGVADHRGVGHTGAESAVLVQARPVNGYRFDMPLVMSASAGRPASIQTQQELAPDPGTLAPVTGVQAATGAQMQQATVPEAGTASQTDMDDLVDRVLRTLMRRLAVEGERREWQRW